MGGLDVRAVTPRDCTLAVAIPLTRVEFLDDLRAPEKDFAKSYARRFGGFSDDDVWTRYERYARLVRSVADEVEAAGVRVIRGARFAALTAALTERHVFTLVAHWRNHEHDAARGRIELTDGLREIDDVVAAIPPDYRGVIDLTVCHSVLLGDGIARLRPDCVVIMNRGNAKLDYRCIVYRHVIRQISHRPESYVDVVARLRVALLKGD